MPNASNSLGRFFKTMWRYIRWPLAALIVVYVVAVAYYIYITPKQSAAAVERVHARKLTVADVDGSHLPPIPDPAMVDATVEGVDANGNNIRDDVELAIFKKYPNDTKLRAAALQYALHEGEFLTQVVDKKSWKAVAEETGRANLCIKDSGGQFEIENSIDELIFNTDERKSLRERVFEYTTSYGDAEGEHCDLKL